MDAEKTRLVGESESIESGFTVFMKEMQLHRGYLIGTRIQNVTRPRVGNSPIHSASWSPGDI